MFEMKNSPALSNRIFLINNLEIMLLDELLKQVPYKGNIIGRKKINMWLATGNIY